MTGSKKKTDFDADLVRELADLLSETGLSEIEYASGDLRIRVARTPQPASFNMVGGGAASHLPAAAASGATREADALLDHPGLLTSPMVGVVYTGSDPASPPFVKVGDAVEAGATLLLIEAMKVFNPIKAPRAGVVTRILVSNGVPVEYGEPLLILE
ncbi:MAG: acetyl-CoA carboxylase biotin carboxyl carrier protein [Rhodospirillales bacterium]|nr:acetyl-CoA carboxylase biotin carboxyl carrier protein [Rhodospirillales bacterium]